MRKQSSRSASQIITMFTQATQEMELQVAKHKFDIMTQELKMRREEIMNKIGGQEKTDKKVDASKSEKFKTMDEHRITLPQLQEKLQTNIQTGLSQAEAEQRIILLGKNQLTEKKKTPWFMNLFHELSSMFACMMWAGSALCFLAYGLTPEDPSNLYLGIVLAVVVSITGVMAYFQNQKSEALMEAFKNFIPPETQVIRDGQVKKIPAVDLVAGDVVIIEFGKRIPADIRITESNGMKVDNSSLTGESLLLIRTPECSHPENPLETKNLIFFGTLCKEGNGRGIVLFTGDNTVIGQIAGLAASSGSEETPLRKGLNEFIRMIALIALIIGVIFFILGFIMGYDGLTNLVFAIGIITGFVPEGLLATVTVALSLTARRLASKKVLVKNLEGVETLGSTSCICSDKTGTLTQNKMTVENIWYNNKKCKGHNRQKMGPKFNYEYELNDVVFQELIECSTLCSEAIFDVSVPQDMIGKINNNNAYTEEQKQIKIQQLTQDWKQNLNKLSWLEKPTIGDASETALIKFLQPIQDIEKTRLLRKLATDADGKAAKMPFNSTNKYAFLIVEYETPDSNYCLMTKGAPERIWDLCTTVQMHGKSELKDERQEQQFKLINETFGKQGERVLGFSKLHLPRSQYPKGYQFNVDKMNFAFNQQSFIGLISLIDPPKDAVPDAVNRCKAAGIQVIMVTGDQPVTAAAIAKQVNIISEKTVNEIAEEEGISFEDAFHRSSAIVIHGDKITKMCIDDEGKPESEQGKLLQEWLSKSQIVFARTSPAQKLIIVDGCQKRGHIVAVTGDGVNDSPAIKKADIGISMGITGSDVAKDAADMILLNDDFSNIVIGIEEGRKIFDNLKKTIVFVLSGNIAEVIPFLSFIVLQLPLPLTTVLILCIDLGAGILPSTSFVYEDAEVDIMTRRPRIREENLVTPKLMVFAYLWNGLFQLIAAFLCYFIILNDYGLPASETFFLNGKLGLSPLPNDVYDPTSPYLGSTTLMELYQQRVLTNPETIGQYCTSDDESGFEMVDWIYGKNKDIDLRMYLVKCNTETGRWEENLTWGQCNINQISPISERPICYTTESLQYAQTGFFFGIVITQLSSYQSLKTHKSLGLFQGLNNGFMYLGMTSQLVLMMALAYVVPINIAFGTRDVLFQHMGIPAIPFGLFMQLWNEGRKYMVRTQVSSVQGMPNWWQRCTVF